MTNSLRPSVLDIKLNHKRGWTWFSPFSSYMKARLATLLFLSVTYIVKGQVALSADPVGGVPLQGSLNPRIKGSPYLYDDWEKGTVVLKSGETWKDLELKVDIHKNTVIYKDPEGTPKQIVKPISHVNFNDKPSPLLIMQNGVYLQLSGGKIFFLKKLTKITVENKDYATSSTEKSFVINTSHYLITQQLGLKKIKLSQSDIEKTLPEFRKAIKDFTQTSGHSKLKSEEDFIALFNRINTPGD